MSLLSSLFYIKNEDIYKVIAVFGIKVKLRSFAKLKRKFNEWEYETGQDKNPKVLKIGFVCGGGFGDSLSVSQLIKEVRKLFIKPVIIDFYCKQPSAFQDLPFIDNCYKYSSDTSNYDVYIRARRLLIIEKYNDEKVGRFSELFNKFCKDYIHTLKAKFPIHNSTMTASRYMQLIDKKWCEALNIHNILNLDRNTPRYVSWIEDAFSILDRYALLNIDYIVINRAVDGTYSNKQPKLWKLEYYDRLVELLHKAFPHIKIVQVGASKKYGEIQGVDLNLLEKTTFDEVKVLLKYSLIFVSGEGGLVHLHRFLYGKSAVMFGPTDSAIFGYDENINIQAYVCPFPCEWATKDWGHGCLRGFDEPLCMTSVTPAMVYDAISVYINNDVLKYYYINIDEQDMLQNAENVAIIFRDDAYLKRCQNCTVTIYDTDLSEKRDDYSNNCDFLFHVKEQNQIAEFATPYNIPVFDNTYDLVYCGNWEKVEHPFFAIKEMLRILKPQGHLVLKNLKASITEFNIVDENVILQKIQNM